MVFEGKIYRTYGEIFDKAVELAKEGDKQKCGAYLDSYASYLMAANPTDETDGTDEEVIQRVMGVIEENLVMYSHCYDARTTKLIKDAYFKNQNC